MASHQCAVLGGGVLATRNQMFVPCSQTARSMLHDINTYSLLSSIIHYDLFLSFVTPVFYFLTSSYILLVGDKRA